MDKGFAGETRVARVLLLDNFDSFAFNLVEEFRVLGCKVEVVRNDVAARNVEALYRRGGFDCLVLSPGPGSPETAGSLLEVMRLLKGEPTLGVCLGHQALVELFGGSLKRVEPVHGEKSVVELLPGKLFARLPKRITVGRYHSLAADVVPKALRVTARSVDGVVMGVEHESLPAFGVQFHPESVLSTQGSMIVENFLEEVKACSRR